MSSVWVSSQCQCAVALANLRPISPPTSSSALCASANGSFRLRQPLNGGYGLPNRSGASALENNGNFNPTSCSERPCICWSHRGGGFGAVDELASRDSAGACVVMSFVQQQLPRRELVRAISACIVLPALINAGSSVFEAPAAAAEEDEQIPEPSKSEAPAKIGLIEKLLERSKANKAKYDQERLDAYYRRNFKDYFEFLKGTIRNKDVDALTEAEKGILKWLEKNQ